MKNVTISMDENLLRQIRIEAAKAGVSVSRLIADRMANTLLSVGEESARSRGNPQTEAWKHFLAGPKLHIAVDGRMPTAEERNARR